MGCKELLQACEREHEQQADRPTDQAQRHGVEQIHQAGRIGRELVQRLEEMPAEQDEDDGGHGRGEQAGEQHPEIRLLAAGSALRRFQAQDRAAERRRDKGGEHAADAGIAQRARLLLVELELVGDQRAHAAARIRQRRFGAEAGAGDERHESRDHDPGRVAIVEAPGLAKLEHHFGKDAVVIAKELHQQPDQQAADGADQRW